MIKTTYEVPVDMVFMNEYENQQAILFLRQYFKSLILSLRYYS